MGQNLHTKKGTSYKDAGVNIDAGNRLVDAIKPLAAATVRKGADAKLGGFGGLFDLAAIGYKDPILVSATDGVGTKLKIAFSVNKHDTVGVDLVAMSVNDLVVQGAEPLFFLDYFATGGLDVAAATDVIKGVAEGCKIAGCALIGGETAEMPGMYPKGEYDLAGFAVGVVERGDVLPRQDIKAGDVILGIASSGMHSNGFSLIRHVAKQQGVAFTDPAPFYPAKSFGAALLKPTRIYVKPCLEAVRTGYVKALAHITGGGLLENLPRVFDETLAAEIDTGAWEKLPVFEWVKSVGGIEPQEMYRTFNMGIGMALVVEPEHAEEVQAIIEKHGERAYAIGTMAKRTTDAVILKNLES